MKNETKLKRDAAHSSYGAILAACDLIAAHTDALGDARNAAYSHGAILAACDLIAANTAYSLLAAEAALGAYAAAYDAARKAAYEAADYAYYDAIA